MLCYLLFVLTLASTLLAQIPYHVPRDYINRVYVAITLRNSLNPLDFQNSIKELEGDWVYENSIGSIPNMYIFSASKKYTPIENIRDIQRFDLHFKGNSPGLHKRSLEKRAKLKQKFSFNNKQLEQAFSYLNKMNYEWTIRGMESLEVLKQSKILRRLPVPVDLYPKFYLPQFGSFDEFSNYRMPTTELYQIYRDYYDKKLGIRDPLFWKQWYLFNVHTPGHDINVTNVWANNISGSGVVTAIVDDGVDMYADDIRQNYCEEGSWDYNFNKSEPRPSQLSDYHGTRCAGEIAAVRNDVCGIGVVFNSKVSGIRILSKEITEDIEALAITHGMHVNHIYSCSWGPPDDGKNMARPSKIVHDAILNAINNGRDGKGSIFVFASGNGGRYHDNCNFDGYTNSIYSITVAAIDHEDKHPSYSEACSANLVVTYSSGGNHFIVGTDMSNIGAKSGRKCQQNHGGTSAAAPLAAGIFALALSVRPELTWRDMQYVALHSAVEIDSDNPGWQESAIGKRYHHEFGFGKLDSYRIVEIAKNWKLVNLQTVFNSKIRNVGEDIPVKKYLNSSIYVTKEDLDNVDFQLTEHVTVIINLVSSFRGKVRVTLEDPRGLISELAALRPEDDSTDGFDNWSFMSVAHWGVNPVGEWKLTVENTGYNTKVELINWQLNIYGESSKSQPNKTKIDVDKETNISFDIPNNRKGPVIPPGYEFHTSWWPIFSTIKNAWLYGTIFAIIGFIVIIFIYAYFIKRNTIRRNRIKTTPTSSTFEFDLIPHESTDDDFVYPADSLLPQSAQSSNNLYDPFGELEKREELQTESL